MFDVGFSEMLLIAVVALVVIGPERLPKVARTVGHLIGRLQRYVNDVKADINREMELDELRKFKSEFEDAARSAESTFSAQVAGVQAEMNSLASEAAPETSATDPSATPADVSAAQPPSATQPDLFADDSRAPAKIAENNSAKTGAT